MKIPPALRPLLDDGIVDAVLRQLKSGKEAAVYVVRCGGEERCAKVYKDIGQRSFQNVAAYQEGRKSRGSRDSRAMSRRSRHGRSVQHAQWKSAETWELFCGPCAEASNAAYEAQGQDRHTLEAYLVTQGQYERQQEIYEAEKKKHEDMLAQKAKEEREKAEAKKDAALQAHVDHEESLEDGLLGLEEEELRVLRASRQRRGRGRRRPHHWRRRRGSHLAARRGRLGGDGGRGRGPQRRRFAEQRRGGPWTGPRVQRGEALEARRRRHPSRRPRSAICR